MHHTYDYNFMGFYLKPVGQIQVGDLISVEKDSMVPADILIINASTEKIYIDQTVLNGETTLKKKFVVSEIQKYEPS